jgi:hypothetical protein
MLLSKLMLESPLDFWANTPQISFFGNPNFGNKLLDGGYKKANISKAILLQKIKHDLPSIRNTLKDIIITDGKDGKIELKFIERVEHGNL